MVKSLIAAGAVLALAQPPAMSAPARFRSGTVPALPTSAVGGGEVFLELAVGADGHVTGVTPLRTTPPYTDLVTAAVRDWQFSPAEQDDRPVASTVLVAAIFRPPVVVGPTIGEVPADVGSPSGRAAFPVTTPAPVFPALAHSSGVVLLEVRIDPLGTVADTVPIRSAPPFDAAASDAVKQWRFRPANVGGAPASTYAYAIVGFPLPVVGSPTLPGSSPR
jgi:TonB family protein